jgi:uncharacterized protein with NRDE domain
MCITSVMKDFNELAPIIICHNRDEFHRRASSPLSEDQGTGVIAGIDQSSQGYWLSLSTHAQKPYVVIVLNYRDFSMKNEEKASRGILVKRLSGLSSKEEATQLHTEIMNDYSPHSILIADHTDAYINSNQSSQAKFIGPGVSSFSNGLPESVWPKQKKLSNILENEVKKLKSQDQIIEKCFDALHNNEQFPIEQLPNTYTGEPMEKLLSSIFIKSTAYGTRSSYVLILSETHVHLAEINYDSNGKILDRSDFKK